ncbi:hypothetical protein B0J11DRAFT_538331 [Dendryphion nanum]|uniref:Uncharacterized protein n=1 Tax=Dendryphion nanum TaxID=256645 RepID=A0A9P9DDE5_9PLEO|nr:hypothetical protein B0J11DRAFT_538331 [Dendryphion nanum]
MLLYQNFLVYNASRYICEPLLITFAGSGIRPSSQAPEGTRKRSEIFVIVHTQDRLSIAIMSGRCTCKTCRVVNFSRPFSPHNPSRLEGIVELLEGPVEMNLLSTLNPDDDNSTVQCQRTVGSEGDSLQFEHLSCANLPQANANTSMSVLSQSKITSYTNEQIHSPMDPPLVPPPKPAKVRYYSHALSGEDKLALAVGELNHNHKLWGPTDEVLFQEARINLAHEGVADREEFLEARHNDLREAWKRLQTKPKQVRSLRVFTLSKSSWKSSKSSTGTDTAQTPPFIPQPSPTTTREALTTILATPPAYPLPLLEIRTAMHHRTVSEGDYFSHVPHPVRRLRQQSPLSPALSSPLSSPVSRPSSIVSSNLSYRTQPYTVRPEITFDTFLVAHKSGKGEAFRGADNAVDRNRDNGSKAQRVAGLL